MILSFSQYWPERMGELAGKPNYFVWKILQGLFLNDIFREEQLSPYFDSIVAKEPQYPNNHPKLHTIRHDPNGRWKPGMKIHPRINNRTKNSFQFAPKLECVSVQEIEINHWDRLIYVHNGKNLMNPLTYPEMEQLALNDGFPTVEAFFDYFNEDFKGVFIHWTPLKY